MRMLPVKGRSLPEMLAIGAPIPGRRRADPFTLDRNLGSIWVRPLVLGSRPTPEDQKHLENKCRRRESNSYALAGNGF